MQLWLRYAENTLWVCQWRLLNEWLRDVYAPLGKSCWHSEGEGMTKPAKPRPMPVYLVLRRLVDPANGFDRSVLQANGIGCK